MARTRSKTPRATIDPEPEPARVRRSAADSRSAILDATERELVASGPAGIRLQDVAAEVGVSHPTILHHFQSRENLVAEVVKRRVASMNADVLLAIAAEPERRSIADLLRRLFASFSDGGHARVVAWMALGGGRNPAIDGLKPLARALHAMRVASAPEGAPKPSAEDSQFIVLLTAFALFGEAIAGPLFRDEDPSAPDAGARRRFLQRLTALVETLALAPTAAPAAKAKTRPRRRE